MSAREELIEIVTRDHESSGGDVVWATDLVEELVSDVLREAAEKIRSEAAEMDGWPEEQHVARKYADLIDPDKP